MQRLEMEKIKEKVDNIFSYRSSEKDKKDLKIELRTKSGNIDKFLNLDVLDNFIIAFTLSPEEIALKNEKYTAGFKNRVKAIKELQNKGWNVRICIDPLIYTDDFEKNYSEMIEYLFNEIDKEKTLQSLYFSLIEVFSI